jgi:hypothetical protein
MESDFVEVKLSARGEEIADGAPMTVAGPNYHFVLEPAKTQRVTRAFDWEKVLSKLHRDGELLVELAEIDG